jgi:hypothetical protein
MTDAELPDGWVTTTVNIQVVVAHEPNDPELGDLAEGITDNLSRDWWSADNGCLYIEDFTQRPATDASTLTIQLGDNDVEWGGLLGPMCMGEYVVRLLINGQPEPVLVQLDSVTHDDADGFEQLVVSDFDDETGESVPGTTRPIRIEDIVSITVH